MDRFEGLRPLASSEHEHPQHAPRSATFVRAGQGGKGGPHRVSGGAEPPVPAAREGVGEALHDSVAIRASKRFARPGIAFCSWMSRGRRSSHAATPPGADTNPPMPRPVRAGSAEAARRPGPAPPPSPRRPHAASAAEPPREMKWRGSRRGEPPGPRYPAGADPAHGPASSAQPVGHREGGNTWPPVPPAKMHTAIRSSGVPSSPCLAIDPHEEPEGHTARHEIVAAVTHERQASPLVGRAPMLTPMLIQAWTPSDRPSPYAEMRVERLPALHARPAMTKARKMRTVKRTITAAIPDEAQLLPDDREQEVRVRGRKVEELLHATAENRRRTIRRARSRSGPGRAGAVAVPYGASNGARKVSRRRRRYGSVTASAAIPIASAALQAAKVRKGTPAMNSIPTRVSPRTTTVRNRARRGEARRRDRRPQSGRARTVRTAGPSLPAARSTPRGRRRTRSSSPPPGER